MKPVVLPAARPAVHGRAWAASLALHLVALVTLLGAGGRPASEARVAPLVVRFLETAQPPVVATLELAWDESVLEALPVPRAPEAAWQVQAHAADLLEETLPDEAWPELAQRPGPPPLPEAPRSVRASVRAVTAPAPLPPRMSSDLPAPPVVRPLPRPAAPPSPRPAPPAPRPVPRAAPSVAFAPSPTNYYPEPARREGVSGDVLVAVRIAPGGNVRDAWVVRSSGDARLDAAALRLAADHRFHPLGVEADGRLTIRFRLE